MRLYQLLEGIPYHCLKGDTNQSVVDIAYDSRKAKQEVAFVCLEGSNVDGHLFIEKAYHQGARIFFVTKQEKVPSEIYQAEDITVILVENTRKTLPFLSDNLFGNPAR